MGAEVEAVRGGAVIPIPTSTTIVAASPSCSEPPASVARPATALAIMASIGVGLYAGTLLIAVGLILVVLGFATLRAMRHTLRHGLDAHFERKRKLDRRRARERRLEEAGVSRDALAELTILADEIERRDEELATRYDVEEMLDRHVELTLAHERCLRAMRMCDRDQLARARCEHLSRPGGSRRRASMFERRIRYWDQCKAQSDRCDEELAVLADMIRLLAQKAICPTALMDDDLIERRLDDLDEEETALSSLSVLGNG
jgi:hypothetical protein